MKVSPYAALLLFNMKVVFVEIERPNTVRLANTES